MANQTPSVGRIVHFVYGDVHVPAIIINPHSVIVDEHEIEESAQSLRVFTDINGAQDFIVRAKLDPTGTPGTWHWPEYVP